MRGLLFMGSLGCRRPRGRACIPGSLAPIAKGRERRTLLPQSDRWQLPGRGLTRARGLPKRGLLVGNLLCTFVDTGVKRNPIVVSLVPMVYTGVERNPIMVSPFCLIDRLRNCSVLASAIVGRSNAHDSPFKG